MSHEQSINILNLGKNPIPLIKTSKYSWLTSKI